MVRDRVECRFDRNQIELICRMAMIVQQVEGDIEQSGFDHATLQYAVLYEWPVVVVHFLSFESAKSVFEHALVSVALGKVECSIEVSLYLVVLTSLAFLEVELRQTSHPCVFRSHRECDDLSLC